MRWHRLDPQEIDYELIWLLVSVGAAIVAILWLQSGLPTPRCTWHDLTGYPCVGCGSTRCVRYSLQGAWGAAFAVNPLAFCSFVGLVIYDFYAAIVTVFRLPRLRLTEWPSWLKRTVRGVVIAILLANWAWLIAHKV